MRNLINTNGNEMRRTHLLTCGSMTQISRHFWATVCKTVRTMLSDRCLSVCLSCLSVTLVYCGQPVGRIKMKLSMLVGLGPGYIVLNRDLAPLPQRGAEPPIFGPYLLPPNGCRDQDATWYGGMTRPSRLCVRWRPAPPPQKGGDGEATHVYGPCL